MSEHTDANRRFTVQDEVCENALASVAKSYRLADDMATAATQNFCQFMLRYLGREVKHAMPREVVSDDILEWDKLKYAWFKAYVEGLDNSIFNPLHTIESLNRMKYSALKRFVRYIDNYYIYSPKINRSDMKNMLIDYLVEMERFVRYGNYKDGTHYYTHNAIDYRERNKISDLIREFKAIIQAL
jgi:hypothetical protein